MDRTYVVTGAASGIGAATARYLRERGDRVISCDLHDADVIANLTTREGRAELIDGVARLSGGRIDGIVANAGGGPAETSLQLNFFGAVATLDGLRPLLESSSAPRGCGVLDSVVWPGRFANRRSLSQSGRARRDRRRVGVRKEKWPLGRDERGRSDNVGAGSVRQCQACVKPLV